MTIARQQGDATTNLSRRSLLFGLSTSQSYGARSASVIASEVHGGLTQRSAGKRCPQSWACFALEPGAEATLAFPSPSPAGSRLRLTVANDVRGEHLLTVHDRRSSSDSGRFDIRYAYPLQPFEVEISRAVEGEIILRHERGSEPIWFLSPSGQTSPGLIPQLQKPHASPRSLRSALASLDSLQPFGWMEGCVTEGLEALGQTAALQRHLNAYFLLDGSLRYEGVLDQAVENRIAGVETLLPFAALARTNPTHRAIDLAIEYGLTQGEKPVIADVRPADTRIKTEECYTLAYPLAQIGVVNRRPELVDLAIREILTRRDRLAEPDAVWQRSVDGRKEYRNWARGVAWYLLGLIKVIDLAKGHPLEGQLREAFRTAAVMADGHQRHDGLWNCFLDDAGSGAETSGSAGIAAALAWGARNGAGIPQHRKAAQKTLRALRPFVTTSGFLTGVSQANKGGLALQKGGYRVIAQFAMGLAGQLEAALSNR
jgi:unsaturated rhamnogalacturonyl hydrolase